MLYDLVIVGGGIAGLGLFERASAAGLSVALLERGLPGGATTAVTSGLFHGGLRYLPYDAATSYGMCREIRRLLEEKPGLLKRQPFLWPVYRGHRFGFRLVGALLDYYDLFGDLRQSRRHGRLTREEAISVLPGLSPDGLEGALSFDEWTVDVPRLVASLAQDGRRAGGALLAESPVIGFHRDGARLSSARVAGSADRIAGRLFVNAAGPWAEEVAGLAGAKGVKLRLRKGVHLVFSEPAPRVGLIFPDARGRYLGLYPREHGFLVGPTDDPYDGRPESVRATAQEARTLRAALSRVLPGTLDLDAGTIAGLRPIFDQGGFGSLLSRDFRVHDHAEEGIPNLLTLAGGKLTSHRSMAEHALAAVMAKLGRDPVRSADQPAAFPWSVLQTRRRSVSLAASVGLLAFYAARRLVAGGGEAPGLAAFQRSYGWPA